MKSQILLLAFAAALLLASVAEARSFGSRARSSYRSSYRPSTMHYVAPAALGYAVGHSTAAHARTVSATTVTPTTIRK